MIPYDLTVIRIIRTVVRVGRKDSNWQEGQLIEEQVIDAQVIDSKAVQS